MTEFDDELEFHIEMQTRRFVDAGLDPKTARAKALSRLGDLADVRARQARSTPTENTMPRRRWIATLWQDARYAVRVLARTPLFTSTALVTLAVAIGATTTIFSVVNTVLLRSLPYPGADRTSVIFNAYRQSGLERATVSPEELADLAAQTQVFDRLAGIRPQVTALTDDCPDCEALRVNTYGVSPELFELLGVYPLHGRAFSTADGAAGAPKVIVISHRLWRQRYHEDVNIVGRTVSVGGDPRLVVGVMPPDIQFPDEPVSYLEERADLWIPVNWDQVRDGRGNQYLVVLASSKPGVTTAQIASDLERVGAGFKAEYPSRYNEPAGHWALVAVPLAEEMFGDVRTGLVVLFGAVGCVLLIGCANVANLILARGSTRRREMAVRSALGAGRSRLIQQLLVESLVLTVAGSMLGLGLAAASLQVLVSFNPGNIPRLDTVSIDGTVVLFAMVLSVVTGVVVGLIPAVRQARTDPQSDLGDDARGTDSASPRKRLRGLLVVVEVAVAVVVLIGATLLIRSYISMAGVPVGVSGDGVAVARLSIPRTTYDEPAKVFAFHRAMSERFAALPGVTRASAVYPLPMSGSGWSASVGIAGRPANTGGPEPHAEYAVALPGYFATVGIPLLDGRDFDVSDSPDAPAVVIVDEDFAARYWPGERAVGQRISTFGDAVEGPFQTVIGVVGHVRNRGARDAGEPQLYMAALQKREYSLFYVVETSGDPSALIPSIRAAVRAEDAQLPVAALETMPDMLATFTARERFNVTLFSIFGAIALAIASIGLYGVLAFLVSQRSREIGIRLALGGRPSHLVRSVMLEGLWLTAAGLVVGLMGGLWLGRAMQELLFEIRPTDPATYVAISIVMVVVAVLAGVGPARRATRVNPVESLR